MKIRLSGTQDMRLWPKKIVQPRQTDLNCAHGNDSGAGKRKNAPTHVHVGAF
ncbi:hypothetical protein IMCC12053_669 [Celeribacter marinus]|uniref:Uncharacterized protein n=1 Tax=Celeribacter marinus TaxID=1397108 RepID=A0A0P0A2U8_9RHOB|nr:hypothetical protein IMCC12053_669 [Celeribacter marinus]